MTVSVDPIQFRRALSLAAQVAPRRPKIPVLQTVRCHANGTLQLESTDLDTTCRAELDYSGASADFVLPAPHMLSSALARTVGDTVDLREPEPGKILVETGTFASKLNTPHFDDHPGAELVHFAEWQATMGSGELRQLARIFRAISTEKIRYYLNGVCVTKVGDWTWRFAATDGHRLNMIDIPLPDAKGAIPDGTIMPKHWIQLAIKAFAKTKGPVNLVWGRTAAKNTSSPDLAAKPGSTRIQLSGPIDGVNFTIASKLIDSTYPDYSRVVPTETKHHFEVGKQALLGAIRTLSPLHGGRTRAFRLSFANAGHLSLELYCPDIGRSTIELPIEGEMPHDYAIGINGEYLRDMADALTGEAMAFALNGPSDPLVIRDPADTQFLGVQMPMMV